MLWNLRRVAFWMVFRALHSHLMPVSNIFSLPSLPQEISLNENMRGQSNILFSIFEKIVKIFPFFHGFQRILFLQIFEVHYQSSSWKVSPCSASGKYIGAHHMGACGAVRALSGSEDEGESAFLFLQFSSYTWEGARILRAQPRARSCDARQSILWLFGCCDSVSSKLPDLAKIQVRAKLFISGGRMSPPGAQHNDVIVFARKYARTFCVRAKFRLKRRPAAMCLTFFLPVSWSALF